MRRSLGIEEIALAERPFAQLRPDVSAEAWQRLQAACDDASDLLAGRRIWWVSSSPRGGGVAEMMRTLLPYWRGIGLDAHWLVILAPTEFFHLTKRLHNLLHGGAEVKFPNDSDRALFKRSSDILGAHLVGAVRKGDVVVLQDPQTAGLIPALRRAGAIVIWRCHVGADRLTAPALAAWNLLLPYLGDADSWVFTRASFVPPTLDSARAHIVTPAIDPCSAKNAALREEVAREVLVRCGLAAGPGGHGAGRGEACRRIQRRVHVLRDRGPLRLDADRLVVALARWDRLKDPVGIMHAFAEHVPHDDVRLVLAGPSPAVVADDPEGLGAFRETCAAWSRLSFAERARVQLATLPMTDLDENALIVNALQREAAVVVKKSLQEGFGLGVTEAMWKGRPVAATGVGGHLDQIDDHRTGLLVADPSDLAAFGRAVCELLDDGDEGRRLGLAAREHVRDRFLADRHLVGWVAVLGAACAGAMAVRPSRPTRTREDTEGAEKRFARHAEAAQRRGREAAARADLAKARAEQARRRAAELGESWTAGRNGDRTAPAAARAHAAEARAHSAAAHERAATAHEQASMLLFAHGEEAAAIDHSAAADRDRAAAARNRGTAEPSSGR